MTTLFTSINSFSTGTCGHDENLRMINFIEADTKRPGLLKMSQFITKQNGKKPQRFSLYYGKCNQAKIIEISKKMIKFESR